MVFLQFQIFDNISKEIIQSINHLVFVFLSTSFDCI